ncbi:hypothetical protein ACHAXT_009833 [Thalassiosira profunda]
MKARPRPRWAAVGLASLAVAVCIVQAPLTSASNAVADAAKLSEPPPSRMRRRRILKDRAKKKDKAGDESEKRSWKHEDEKNDAPTKTDRSQKGKEKPASSQKDNRATEHTPKSLKGEGGDDTMSMTKKSGRVKTIKPRSHRRGKLHAEMGAYPGYDGPLDPSGLVSVTFHHEGNLKLAYDLAGLSPECEGCVIHIDEGQSCRSLDLAGPYYDVKEDPWTEDGGAAYDSNKKGKARGHFELETGYDTAEENAGHAAVIFDEDGTGIACGVLQEGKRGKRGRKSVRQRESKSGKAQVAGYDDEGGADEIEPETMPPGPSPGTGDGPSGDWEVPFEETSTAATTTMATTTVSSTSKVGDIEPAPPGDVGYQQPATTSTLATSATTSTAATSTVASTTEATSTSTTTTFDWDNVETLPPQPAPGEGGTDAPTGGDLEFSYDALEMSMPAAQTPQADPAVERASPVLTTHPSYSPTTPWPTWNPTDSPIAAAPTDAPSAEPTTSKPTPSPTENTPEPSRSPSTKPTTFSPSEGPTFSPTVSPSDGPTTAWPSMDPTGSPNETPTSDPSASPTPPPSVGPTRSPTAGPIAPPTSSPITEAPSGSPTPSPSTSIPTSSPTDAATTASPSKSPSKSPTPEPSGAPAVLLELPVCPEAYDPLDATTYTEGSQVELNSVVYQCQPYPYAFYCTQLEFRPDPDHAEDTLWMDAWAAVGPCRHASLDGSTSASPTHSPTGSPKPGPTANVELTQGSPSSSSPTSGPTQSLTGSPSDPLTAEGLPVNPAADEVPEKRFIEWSSLGDIDRGYATDYLGYDEYTWDYPGENELETYASHDLYPEEVEGLDLGISEDMWDCHINHYAGYYWSELEESNLDQYFSQLGWDESSWDGDRPEPETESKYWDDLTQEQQMAAAQVCYSSNLWDGTPLPEWETNDAPMPPTEQPISSPPTPSPTPLQYCPPPYDFDKTDYVAGQLVEINAHVFECSPKRVRYCNILAWDDSLLAEDVNAKDKWDTAWVLVGECYKTESPTAGPSASPTSSPSQKPTPDPTLPPSSSPTVQPSGSPTMHPTEQASSLSPTRSPSNLATNFPSASSTTMSPSKSPTLEPSNQSSSTPIIDVADIMSTNVEPKSDIVDESYSLSFNPAVSDVPETRFLPWSSLSASDLHYASNNLRYDEYGWNIPGEAEIESWSYHDLYDEEVVGISGLGISGDMWDCHVNHYGGYWWSDIEFDGYAEYLEVLGWNADNWDGDEALPASESKVWDDLTPQEQAAATQLCYTRELWDEVPIPYWS